MAKANEIVGLDCEADVLRCVKVVLATRLAEMCTLRANALNFEDIEGVHDMRVASRRLRSAVGDFSVFVRRRDLRRLKKGIRDVAGALGGVRDEDVAIAALEKLAGKAPAEIADGIERLTDERRRTRDERRGILLNAIAEDRLARIQQQWHVALDEVTLAARWREKSDQTGAGFDHLTFRDAGRIIITERWNELDSLSTALYRPHETIPLHEMRIAAKKLRYAIELFAQCWGDAMIPFAKEIASMQSSLGELHDCDVWIEWLGEMLDWRNGGGENSRVSSPSHEVYRQNRMAAGYLLRHFAGERTKHFRDALAQWGEWEVSNFGTRLAAQLEQHLSSPATAAANQ